MENYRAVADLLDKLQEELMELQDLVEDIRYAIDQEAMQTAE